MINEQKILSEELTEKQNELLRSERTKLGLERELMELRPLKTSLKTFSDTQQKTIEDATRGEFERNKLQQKVSELETELRIARKDTEELSASYKTLVEQKNILMQQLSHFEKDSFEI